MRLCTTLVLAILVSAGCAASAGDELAWQTEIDTLGDTIVVRTLGAESPPRHTLVTEVRIGELDGADEYTFGSVSEVAVTADGDMYVFDRQANQLRRYDSNGVFVRTVGRKGGGPGEYDRLNGLDVGADGRVYLWDAGNGRIATYTPHGEPDGSWRVQGGFHTSNALTVDSAGRVYSRVGIFGPDVTKWRSIILRYGPGGTPVDTIEVPTYDVPLAQLVARQEGGTSTTNVPYSPSSLWTFAPDQHFVSGRSDAYAIHKEMPDGMVLRIERVTSAVPVSADERSEREESTAWGMRRTQPNWRWNGPPIPDVKPYFKALRTGLDGRIWVQLSQPGEIDADADTTQPTPDRPPPTRHRERSVWDVFASDGRFLGQVELPWDFSMYVARGDHVWGVQRDELDVQSVVRARIDPPLGQRPVERAEGGPR